MFGILLISSWVIGLLLFKLLPVAASLGIVIGFTACITGFKKHPDLAIFGFLVVFLSFTSGPAQGMYRYVLAAPPVFLFLSRLGRNPIFDRVWTITSTLIMSIMCAMYMFNMWSG